VDPPPGDPPVDPPPDDLPTVLQIGGLTPNPSAGSVHWELKVPPGMEAQIEVFDAAGRLVHEERLLRGVTGGGWIWSGRRGDGSPAPAGTYYLRIRTGDVTEVRRATLLR
jgi:hypothetical protein